MSLPTASCLRCRTGGMIRPAQRQGCLDADWQGVFLCNGCVALLDARYRIANDMPAASPSPARLSDLYPD